MTISNVDVTEFLQPILTLPRRSSPGAVFSALREAFDARPIDVLHVERLMERGQVGLIPRLDGRHFPAAEAWNKMATERKFTPAAMPILDVTSRYRIRRIMTSELAAAMEKGPETTVDIAQFFKRLSVIVPRIAEAIRAPVVDPLKDRDQKPGLPTFLDLNNTCRDGEADLIALCVDGWSRFDLAVNRRGLGWRSSLMVDYLKNRAPVAEQTLSEFVGHRTPLVVPDADLREGEKSMIAKTISILQAERRALGHSPGFRSGVLDAGGCFREIGMAGHDGFRFLVTKGGGFFATLLILDDETRELAGGCVSGTPWVSEAYRGRGLGKALHEADYQEALGLMRPTHFSESGYRTRLAHHRDAVLSAVSAGRNVHPENLDRYADHLAAERRTSSFAM